MTNTILRGKSDEENPYARFDMGEVASEKSRRGSLLYNGIFSFLHFAVVALMLGTIPVLGDVKGTFRWPEPTEAMKPWVYNWWMASAVDAAGLDDQCREMERQGFGGFHVIHIYGAKGYEGRYREFLSTAWVEGWNLAVRTARAHHLGVDLTMGSGWCFGGPWVTRADAASSGMKVKRPGPGGGGYMIDPFSAAAMSNHVARFTALFGRNGTAERPRAFYHDSFEYVGARPRQKGDAAAMQIGCFRVWTDWCRENGYLTRNQAHGAPTNWLDLYAIADIPETEMFGEGPHDAQYNRDTLVAKFASSSAHVKGTALVSAETGTWVGEHFCERPFAVRNVIDRLFLAGVNHIFYHGLCYSPAAEANVPWPGWCFYASLEMNPRNPLWREVGALNAYVTRCQSLFQTWRPDNDLLLVVDMPYCGDLYSVHNSSRWFYSRKGAGNRAKMLWTRGYQFDYVSPRQIAEHPELKLRLDAAHAKPSPFSLAANGLESTRWTKDGHVLHFILNPSGVAKMITADVAFTVMDPLDGRIFRTKSVALEPNHTLFVVDIRAPHVSAVQDRMLGVALAGGWTVTPVCGGPVLPAATNLVRLAGWQEWDAAFAGTMCYSTSFARSSGRRFLLDLGDVREIARVRVNGRDLGVRYMPPYAFEVPDGVCHAGENALEVEVTSLGANRLRWNDRTGVTWKTFRDINMLNVKYRPLDAAKWPVVPCGLLGPVRFCPL